MKPDRLLCIFIGLALATLSTMAQMVTDPDWKESQEPQAPTFSTDQLIPIEMPVYISVRMGVDPATFTVTPDGIVRYVVVAMNASGSTSAMYEGIRCASAEVKTYARYAPGGPWSPVPDPQWRGLFDNQPSRHALLLARQGLCDGRTPAGNSAAAIVNALKYPKPTD